MNERASGSTSESAVARDRLIAAARAYHKHREEFGHLPATDEPNPAFNEFMVALMRAFPEGRWNSAGGIAKLIVLVAGEETA